MRIALAFATSLRRAARRGARHCRSKRVCASRCCTSARRSRPRPRRFPAAAGRAVVGPDDLERQRLSRTLELMLRRGRLRLGGREAVSQPAARVHGCVTSNRSTFSRVKFARNNCSSCPKSLPESATPRPVAPARTVARVSRGRNDVRASETRDSDSRTRTSSAFSDSLPPGPAATRPETSAWGSLASGFSARGRPPTGRLVRPRQ